MPEDVWTPVDKETAHSVVGEGIHTGLRKGSDTHSSSKIWDAISDSEDGGWSDAIEFFLRGLDVMGMAICKKEER